MTAIKVSADHFVGGANLSPKGAPGLAEIVRGLAIDNARNAVAAAAFSDLHDNSGGTNAGHAVAMVIPTAPFDATSAGGTQAVALNTSLAKVQNAIDTLGDYINNGLLKLGLEQVDWPTGTVSSGTIGAMDSTTTGGTGAAAADFLSTTTAFGKLRDSFATVVYASNQVAAALGKPLFADASGGTPDFDGLDLADLPPVVTDTGTNPGADSVALTVANAFLLAAKNNVASLARFQNGLLALHSTAYTDFGAEPLSVVAS